MSTQSSSCSSPAPALGRNTDKESAPAPPPLPTPALNTHGDSGNNLLLKHTANRANYQILKSYSPWVPQKKKVGVGMMFLPYSWQSHLISVVPV